MKKNSMWNRNFILVFLCNLLIAFSFHILTPTLPKYVVAMGGSVEMAGLVATAFTVTSVITRPFAGYYIGIKSRKKILMVSVSIIATAILGYMFSPSVAIMMAFRLLHGIGWGMATTATSTVLVASILEEQIGRAIGLYGICSSLASVFAPNLGLQLSDSIGYFYMFLVAFVLAAGGCLLGLLIKESDLRASKEKPAEKINLLNRLFAKETTVPALITLSVGAGMAVITNFIALYADSLRVENIGYFFTVAGAVMLFTRPLFGRLSDSRYNRTIVLVALGGFSLVFLTLGLARTLPTFLLGAALYGTFYGALGPMMQSWCVRSVDVSKSGMANSAYYTALDIGNAIGAPVGGWISARMGYGSMYFIIMTLQLMALVFVFVWTMRERERHG